jgi:hypothetical protein
VYVQVAARLEEVRKEEAAHAALETALSTEEVEELRKNTEAGWHSEQSAERLQAKVVRVCEEARRRAERMLERSKRMLERATATQDKAELREVWLEAVKTADKDTLCAMAVQAAAQEGVDMKTRAEDDEELKDRWLVVAAKQGYVETVRAMLAAGANKDLAVGGEGGTPLTAAADRGHLEVVRVLLEAYAEVDQMDNAGETPMSTAAHGGHVEIIEVLLEAAADVNHVNDSGETALWWAALGGHVDAVRALLEAGAEMDHEADFGGTAWDIAAESIHVEAIRALLLKTRAEDQEDVEEVNKTPSPRIKESMEGKNDATEGQQPAKVGFVATPDFSIALRSTRRVSRNQRVGLCY